MLEIFAVVNIIALLFEESVPQKVKGGVQGAVLMIRRIAFFHSVLSFLV